MDRFLRILVSRPSRLVISQPQRWYARGGESAVAAAGSDTSAPDGLSQWVCPDKETFQKRMEKCLLEMQSIYGDWSSYKWLDRKLPSQVLNFWVPRRKHHQYPFLYRASFGYSLIATGTFTNAFHNYIKIVDKKEVVLTTDSPIRTLNQLIVNNLSICNVPLITSLFGFSSENGAAATAYETLLIQSLENACGPNSIQQGSSEIVTRPVGDRGSHPSKGLGQPLYSSSSQPNALTLFALPASQQPGWVLLHSFDDFPTISIILFAHPNSFLRAKQLQGLKDLRRSAKIALNVSNDADLRMNFLILPSNFVDHLSLFQTQRLLGSLTPSLGSWTSDLFQSFLIPDFESVADRSPLYLNWREIKHTAEREVLAKVNLDTSFPSWMEKVSGKGKKPQQAAQA